MTRGLVAFTHDACLAHAPPGNRPHVENPARLVAAREGVAAWDGPVEWRDAREATLEEVRGVHSVAHVERVRAACEQGGWIDPDTYAVPASWRAALVSAGAAVEAAESAARGVPAFALARPPGHHATPERAMGFCLLNGVAIAAHALTRDGKRVAIIDVDVHHGNGTQDCFEARDDVLYVSLHQSPLYPGTGHVEEAGEGAGDGFTLNLPVPAGTAHAGWLECFDAAVVPVVRAFAPDVVLVSAGFDAHATDPLAGLDLVAPTFFDAVTRLRAISGPRIAAVLEGGYNPTAIRACATATAAALAGDAACLVSEPARDGVRPWARLRSAVERAHGARWPLSPGT